MPSTNTMGTSTTDGQFEDALTDGQFEDALLLEFCRQATSRLDRLDRLDIPVEQLSDIRTMLLTAQLECLQSSIDCSRRPPDASSPAWTESRLRESLINYRNRERLKSTELERAMEAMDFGARRAFCRLVLYSEYMKDQENQIGPCLKSAPNEGDMKDSDVSEFSGLCVTSVQLPEVKSYLQQGTPIFPRDSFNLVSSEDLDTCVPRSRLEKLQNFFMLALGYDPDSCRKQFTTILGQTDEDDAGGNDDPMRLQLHAAYQAMTQTIEAIMDSDDNGSPNNEVFDSHSEDNFTRVISVSYTEKLVDAVTGEPILTLHEDAAPHSERISQDCDLKQATKSDDLGEHNNREEEWRVARQTARLQQDILDELVGMSDEDRTDILNIAHETVDRILKQAFELPLGAERVSFLTTLDPQTQRFLAMHKVWNGRVAAGDHGTGTS